MKTPFTTEQFFEVFEKYNSSIFPLQWIILCIGIVFLFLLHSNSIFKGKIIGSFIGLLWIWMGYAYHISFFTEINKAAWSFGSVFILQGILLLIHSVITSRIDFNFTPNVNGYLAYFFIIFGLIIYPLISYFSEGSLERTISLGLPCPTTILTFGFFMLTVNKFPKYLLIIPSLWAVIGLSAAYNFGVYQDVMILLAAIVANIFILQRKKKA